MKEIENKDLKAKLNKKSTDDFKKKYFEYYDDVKSSTHKIIDW